MEYIYEVWALGYNAEGEATDVDIFLDEFGTAEKAISFASGINSIEAMKEAMDSAEFFNLAQLKEGDFLMLQVQKCIEHEAEDELDPEEGYTECIDVLYECELR